MEHSTAFQPMKLAPCETPIYQWLKISLLPSSGCSTWRAKRGWGYCAKTQDYMPKFRLGHFSCCILGQDTSHLLSFPSLMWYYTCTRNMLAKRNSEKPYKPNSEQCGKDYCDSDLKLQKPCYSCVYACSNNLVLHQYKVLLVYPLLDPLKVQHS